MSDAQVDALAAANRHALMQAPNGVFHCATGRCAATTIAVLRRRQLITPDLDRVAWLPAIADAPCRVWKTTPAGQAVLRLLGIWDTPPAGGDSC